MCVIFAPFPMTGEGFGVSFYFFISALSIICITAEEVVVALVAFSFVVALRKY